MDVKISKASGNDITLVVTPQAKQTIVIDRTASKGTVTSVAAVGGTGISVTGSPITSDGTLTITNTAPDQTVALTGAGTTTVTGTYPNFTITSTGGSGGITSVTGTAPIVSTGGATPAISITSSGANSAVLRDANLNISANSISESYSNVAAAGTTTILTASSAPNYVVTGSGGQTFQLPNATTLPNGTNYQFNNNQTSGTIVVKNNSSTTVATIQAGGFVDVSLLSNATAAGSWDVHNIAPSNVSWSTNTFDYAGSITSATWNGATIAVNRGGTGATTLTGYVKGTGTTAMTASATIPVGDISATGTPSSTTYLRGDGSWSAVSGMVYPSATGIAYYDGTAWGTSYTTSGSGTIVALADSPTFTTALTATGSLQLTGDSSSNHSIATNQLTNTLTIGGTSATGTLQIGQSTSSQPINIGGIGAASGTISIGRGTTAGAQTVQIGTAGTIVNIGAGSGVQTLTLGRSVQAQTVNINNGTSTGKTTNIASLASSGTNTVTIGSTVAGDNVLNICTGTGAQTLNIANGLSNLNNKTIDIGSGSGYTLFTLANTANYDVEIGGYGTNGTVNIATAGIASSAQTIAIGSSLGYSLTTINGLLKQQTYTVSTLPTGSAGAKSFVTNALSPVFGAAVVGGGSVGVPVYHDGTSWKVG